MTHSPEATARALAAALVADMARAPSLQAQIARGFSGEQLGRMILGDIRRMVEGNKTVPLFPNIRALMKTEINVEEARLSGAMGQIDWGAIVGGVIGAAGAFVAAKWQTSAQLSIAKLQAEQQQLAVQAAGIDAAKQRLALAAAQGVPSAAASVEGGGLPSWAIPVGAAAVVGIGVATVLATRGGKKPARRSRGRRR